METIYVMANIVYKNCVLFQIEIKKKKILRLLAVELF